MRLLVIRTFEDRYVVCIVYIDRWKRINQCLELVWTTVKVHVCSPSLRMKDQRRTLGVLAIRAYVSSKKAGFVGEKLREEYPR